MNKSDSIKNIARFPLYEFTSEGCVISYVKKNPRALKPIKLGLYKGFQLLKKDGFTEKIYLHRVIAEAFHGRCPDGMECRHLDGNKENNKPENLAWGTRGENVQDRLSHGTSAKGEKNAMSKLTESLVLSMRGYRSLTGDSYAKIARKYNVSTMTAYRAIVGNLWGHVK